MFFAGPFTFFINPLLAIWSRHHEYEADRFATEALNSGKDLKEALIRLNKKNLSNPLPHPLYSFYYYSHPALSERIKALDAFTKK
jgi:STE24 endopeptidase